MKIINSRIMQRLIFSTCILTQGWFAILWFILLFGVSCQTRTTETTPPHLVAQERSQPQINTAVLHLDSSHGLSTLLGKTFVEDYVSHNIPDIAGKTDAELRLFLEGLLKDDQKHREQIHAPKTKKAGFDTVWAYYDLMEEQDVKNQEALAFFIDTYGWPSEHRFGKAAAQAAWYISWHADLDYQLRHIYAFRKVADSSPSQALDYAILYDRIQISQGRNQVYGTHGRLDARTKKIVLLPCDSSTEIVNKTRKEIGIPPVEPDKADIVFGTYWALPN